jgi:hypothetical protein
MGCGRSFRTLPDLHNLPFSRSSSNGPKVTRSEIAGMLSEL